MSGDNKETGRAFRLMTALSNVDPELLERSERAILETEHKDNGRRKMLAFRITGIAAAAVICIGVAGISLYNLGFKGGNSDAASQMAPTAMEAYSLASDTSAKDMNGAPAFASGIQYDLAVEEADASEIQYDLAVGEADASIGYDSYANDPVFGMHIPSEYPAGLEFAYGYYDSEDCCHIIFEGAPIGDQAETELDIEFTLTYSDELVTYMLDACDATVDNVENLVNNGVVAIKYDDGVVEIFRGRLISEDIIDMLR